VQGVRPRLLIVAVAGVLAFVPGWFAYAAIDHPLAGTPYGTALGVCAAVAVLSWMASFLTRDASWVDRLWSIVPALYCGIVLADVGFGSTRISVMTALACLWGARLTFNLIRRGGWRPDSEDYRWSYLREQISQQRVLGRQMGEVGFQVFNVLFVSFGQMALIWLFTSPVHQAWQHADVPLGWLDYVATMAFLVLLLLEIVADEQVWRFQQNKARLVAQGADVERPFLTEGLFRYCRHPNCTCEQAMWIVFYLFAVSASGRLWHWTGLGWVLLLGLFAVSTRLTEKISAQRYAAYSLYQAAVPMFVPNPLNPRRRRAQPVYL
jgi:steroid 5-alpha reductase family enzyme